MGNDEDDDNNSNLSRSINPQYWGGGGADFFC